MKCNFFVGEILSEPSKRRRNRFYSLPPLATSGTPPISIKWSLRTDSNPSTCWITNQLLYQLSYTSVEIGLPASYPLYAPKRRIMALKYNINSSGLSEPLFTGRRKTFYGARYAPFPLAFLPRGYLR